jgi:hypothetical protein
MTSVRNQELKSVFKIASSDASALNIGGLVAAGHTRWVTFLQIDSPTVAIASSNKIHFTEVDASATKNSMITTTNRKLMLAYKATSLSDCSHKLPIMMPEDGPDPEAPLFSIAGGKYLGVYTSVTTAHVFCQYFDE